MSDVKKHTQKLAGQRVLVIGGSSGIGFGVAEALVENGCHVTISSSSADKVHKSISRLEQSYPSAKGRIQGYLCNLKTPDAATEVANLFSNVGTVDHVIFTAGDPLPIKKLEEWTLPDMQQAGLVRFFGPILVAQHLKKHLSGGPNSSYTLTSGNIAEKPGPDWMLVNGYMSGVYGLMRNMALDLAPIRVNVVSPGAVETELWDGLRESGKYEEAMKHYKTLGTTGEIGTVEDVAEAYLYLMKDKNVTGVVIGSNSGVNLK